MKLEFYRLERLFFGNSSLIHDNFYSTCDHKETEVLFYSFLVDNPLKNDKLDRLFVKDLKILTDFIKIHQFPFSDFLYFKSELDILSAYLLLFLVKTFEGKSKLKRHTEDLVFSRDRDFLFDRNDFINVFLNFLHKFLLFVEIKFVKRIPLSKEALRRFVFRFTTLCSHERLISIQDLSLQNRQYKILHFILFQIPHLPHVAFYVNPFNHYIRSETEFYAYNSQFCSLIEVTRSAKYSNSSFQIPKDQLAVLFERSLFIDRKFLRTAFDFLLKEQNVKTDDDLDTKILELHSKIRKFTEEGDFLSLRLCHAKLSKFLSLIRIQTVLSMRFDDLRLFLPFMFCFRGRIYELSDLSFTFYREFRFCLYVGFYEDEVENFHPINANLKLILEKQFSLFEDFVGFSSLFDIRKFALVWIFISIGALKKLELGKEVHVSTFIQKGKELWKERNFSNFADVYEKIEFNYLIDLVDELLSLENPLKKRIFWKDAPASCFQHQLLILGESTPKSYKICNLDSSDTWYDPYSFLISDFFEKNCDKITKNLYTESGLMLTQKTYFEVFSRKRLKKVLMTESYGAGYKKLSFFFKLNLDLANRPKEEENAILSVWENFFDYISNENLLFAQSSKAIVNYFVEENVKTIENPDKTKVDYSCFKIKINQSEIYIEKKRHTIQSRIITTEEDEDQFKTSIRANFVQTQDAVLARRYILITGMWSVHDCFSIDILNVTYMVALINELMNGEFYNLQISQGERRVVYSFFIVL